MPDLDIGEALLKSKHSERNNVEDWKDVEFPIDDTPERGRVERKAMLRPQMSPSHGPLHSPAVHKQLSQGACNVLEMLDELPDAASEADDGEHSQNGHAALGVVDTCINLVSALLGAGLLTVPYSFELGGWLTALFYFSMSSVAAYTCVIIKWCMDRAETEPNPYNEPLDWPFIGYVAFGRAGKRVVEVVFYGELWFVLMSFIVVNGSNLDELLSNQVPKTFLIAGSGAVSFLCLFLPVRMLTYFSAVGFLAMAFTILFVGWTGFELPEPAKAGSFKTFDSTHVSTIAGQALFCNVAHTVVPSIFNQMKSRRQVPCTVAVSFSSVTIVYLLAGFVGYAFFAGSVKDNIIANIGKDLHGRRLPGFQALPLLAAAAFATKLQVTFPLLAAPLIRSVESTLNLRSKFVTCSWRALFMAGTTSVAVLLQDNMAACISLTGCLFATCTCFIFPALFYWSLHRYSISLRQLTVLGLLLAMGLYFMIAGSIKNASDMMKQLQ